VFRRAKVSFRVILKDMDLAMVPGAAIGADLLVQASAGIAIFDDEQASQKPFEYLHRRAG
jgi:hydrogenase maturation factor